MTITWKSEIRNIADLKPNPNNPRTVTKEAYKTLLRNIKRNGYANRLIINTDNMVLCGNQRLKALQELGYTEIEALIPSETLNSDQIDDIVITDNLSAGAWDFDCLSSLFAVEKLVGWGMPEEWLIGEKPEAEPKEPVEKKTKLCPSCGEILN